ncbi:ABC-type dipeptide transport system, periplasmic component [Leptolyngbyaceae cyanobacterium JSC-12]|nr:ABC-type dipeptide transport system, periplasmic component [Leptolyngbyaceae cyanobacterium JSC-12]
MGNRRKVLWNQGLATLSWNRLRRVILGWLILLCILPLASCQSTGLKRQTARGSQLVISTLTDPKTFNFANNQSFPNIFLFAFEGLTRETGTGEIVPALAESWTISDDKKRVVFTLRAGLQWSDGKPLTADDVVFTYRDVVFNPDIPTDAKDSIRIGPNEQFPNGVFPEVRKLSDRQVEFLLPEPFAPFLRATAAPDGIMIMPKHCLEETLKTKGRDGNLKFISTWNTDTPPQEIIVNGPYLLESYTPGQRLVFRRNPYYWRKDPQGNPLPYIDRIVWQFIENTDTQLIRFRSGELDVVGDARPLRPEYYSLLKQEEKRGNFQVYNGGPWSGVLYMTFNLNPAKDQAGKPIVDPVKLRWFSNLAFRQAIAHAIDRQKINTNIFRGLGIVQNSPVSVQSPYFLTPEQGLRVYEYDPEKAKNLLQAAGFQYNAQNQLLDAKGNRVRFTLLTNAGNKVREAIGAQIKEDLGKIGIQVDFTPINFNVLVEKTSTTRDWDAHIIGFTGGIEPHSAANLWMSTGGSHSFNLKQQPGQPPIQGWQPYAFEQEIDRLMIAGARELDETKRKAIYAQYQRVVQDNLPVIFLVNDRALMAARNTLKGIEYSGLPSWGLWNIDALKVEARK